MPLYESIGNVVRQIYDMRIAGSSVLDVATNFPSAERFFCAWQNIRDEARAVAQQMHRVPRFHEIMCEQISISANDMRGWGCSKSGLRSYRGCSLRFIRAGVC